MENRPSTTVSRRMVAAGGAWAVPAAVAAAAAPAFAASRCTPRIAPGGGVGVYWGPNATCTSLNLSLGGQTFLCGLPPERHRPAGRRDLPRRTA